MGSKTDGAVVDANSSDQMKKLFAIFRQDAYTCVGEYPAGTADGKRAEAKAALAKLPEFGGTDLCPLIERELIAVFSRLEKRSGVELTLKTARTLMELDYAQAVINLAVKMEMDVSKYDGRLEAIRDKMKEQIKLVRSPTANSTVVLAAPLVKPPRQPTSGTRLPSFMDVLRFFGAFLMRMILAFIR